MTTSIAVETGYKLPGESKRFAFDFANKLAADDTLLSGEAVTEVMTNDLAISDVARSGTTVTARIADGTEMPYKLLVSVATTEGDTLQMRCILEVD